MVEGAQIPWKRVLEMLMFYIVFNPTYCKSTLIIIIIIIIII